MFKNIASQKITVFNFTTATNVAKTGDAANMSCYVSKDDGTLTVLGTNTATEIDATHAPGYYTFPLAQAETNGDKLLFAATTTTAGCAVIAVPAVVYTTPNRFTTIVVDAAGIVDANTVKLGPSGSGTAQTARDIGASVLLSTGTGTGQLDFTGGIVKANAVQILGTAVSTPATAGVLDVNVKNMNNVAATAITTIKAVQGLTTADTITTVTNQLTAAAIAAGVWKDTTAGDFTTAGSIGKSIMNGVTLGTGLTINGYTGNTPQTGDAFLSIGTAGAGLTALGDTRIAALDANVSSRMATYTQPTGFLAATFPTGTIANTTNITAGTITNLTNAPTAGDFTSTMKTSIGTAVAASAVASVTGSVGSISGVSFPTNFNALSISSGGLVSILSNRKKGSTATFEFLMQDSSTGAPKTGLTVAATISKDGGASTNTINSVTEIGLGQYQIVLTATEMTANNLFLQFTATDAITYNCSIQTQL